MKEIGLGINIIDEEENIKKLLFKYQENNVHYIFISLHNTKLTINDKDKIINIINYCHQYNIKIMADIGRRTKDFFTIEELIKLNIYCLRIDYGYTDEEIKLLNQYSIVGINASTKKIDDFIKYQGKNIIFTHNYYPRKLTGLSYGYFKKQNWTLKLLGYKVYAFTNSDLSSNLVTIEDNRNNDPIYNILKMFNDDIDVVFIAEEVSDKFLDTIKKINSGYIELKVNIMEKYKNYLNQIYHNRDDYSDCLIRIKESREYSGVGKIIEPDNLLNIKKGDICISNYNSNNYSGELSIFLQDYTNDGTYNVIGNIYQSNIKYLDLIKNNIGFLLKF